MKRALHILGLPSSMNDYMQPRTSFTADRCRTIFEVLVSQQVPQSWHVMQVVVNSPCICNDVPLVKHFFELGSYVTHF